MDSAHTALSKLKSSSPLLYKKLCGDAKVLSQQTAFKRLIHHVGGLVGKNELSFVPTAGATQIDTHLAAMREGAKIPLHIIDTLASIGAALEDVEHGGVEKEVEPYTPPENE